MPPIINFKMCDNSADCDGIDKCPYGVFIWDDKKKTISIDKKKCKECGACVDACPIGAIYYAKDKKEYKQMQKQIADDPRTIAELLVERYGSAPVVTDIVYADADKIARRTNTKRPTIIELNRESTISCLLRSVPIEHIQECFHIDATYAKFFINDKDMESMGVTETPCLKFYAGGKLLGQIDGYFTQDEKYSHLERIKEFAKSLAKTEL